MRILVTGASGHIGATLVPRLVEAGHTVTVLAHSDMRSLEGLELRHVQGDVLDPASLRAACEGQERVFHLAAIISTHGDPGGWVQRINVEGTRNVLAACRAAGVSRVVHFSSIHALADHDGPIDETRPLALSPKLPAYDRSKAMAEALVAEAVRDGLDVVIVNPVGVIGPVDHRPSPMGEVLLKFATGRMTGLVEGGFFWVDVRDVVDGALAAAERGRTGERYLLGSEWVSVVNMAGYVTEFTGTPAPRFVSPRWLASFGAPFVTTWASLTGGRPLYSRESVMYLQCHKDVRCDKARAELGFNPRPARESVRDALAWFRDNGMLK